MNPPETDEYDPFSALFQEHFTIGFGLYILIITGFAIPVVALLLNEKRKSPHPIVKKKMKPAKTPILEVEEQKAPENEVDTNKEDKEDHSRFMPS